ncbi:hypothetical protein BGZ72_010820 [Mortierella alpina]|nr:hypothetical protein BGZ72_010820 [Mortierella alpina]
MQAIIEGGLLSINETASGTEVQSIQLPVAYSDNTEVRFIRNDTQLLVQSTIKSAKDDRRLDGLLLDAESLLVVHRLLIPGDYIDVVKSPGADDHFYAAYGSQLHKIDLQDCIVQPDSRSYTPTCDGTCEYEADFVEETLPTEFTARNGVQFKVTWDDDEDVIVLVTPPGGDDTETKRLSIPAGNCDQSYCMAVFLDKDLAITTQRM